MVSGRTMIGILGSRWTKDIPIMDLPGTIFGPSRYWLESSICDNLKHQKRCLEALFFLECILRASLQSCKLQTYRAETARNITCAWQNKCKFWGFCITSLTLSTWKMRMFCLTALAQWPVSEPKRDQRTDRKSVSQLPLLGDVPPITENMHKRQLTSKVRLGLD